MLSILDSLQLLAGLLAGRRQLGLMRQGHHGIGWLQVFSDCGRKALDDGVSGPRTAWRVVWGPMSRVLRHRPHCYFWPVEQLTMWTCAARDSVSMPSRAIESEGYAAQDSFAFFSLEILMQAPART